MARVLQRVKATGRASASERQPWKKASSRQMAQLDACEES